MGAAYAALARIQPELVTAVAAAIGIPFYLGFVHTPVQQLAIFRDRWRRDGNRRVR
jgi:hypothetical protein